MQHNNGIVTALLFLALPAIAAAAEPSRTPIADSIAAAFQTDAARQHAYAERIAEQERADRAALNLATTLFVGAAAADWAVTAACLKVRCSDHAGHSASFFVGGGGFRNAGAAVALGLGLDVAIVFVAREVIAPDHPKLARAILFVGSGVRVVIAANKIGDLRRNAVRQPQ